jgi:hypothetical protein
LFGVAVIRNDRRYAIRTRRRSASIMMSSSIKESLTLCAFGALRGLNDEHLGTANIILNFDATFFVLELIDERVTYTRAHSTRDFCASSLFALPLKIRFFLTRRSCIRRRDRVGCGRVRRQFGRQVMRPLRDR